MSSIVHGLALAFFLGGQPGSAPRIDPADALVVGQVVDAISGRPIGGAIVSISGPPSMTGRPFPRVLTGNNGWFVFRGLRRGSYNIGASKAGFAEGAHGRTRPAGPSTPLVLAEGERSGGIVVRLWKHASVSGVVVDESGELLVGVRVQAYRRAVIAGRRRYVASGSATTDDRGIYRIAALLPGDYIVGTIPRHLSVPGSTPLTAYGTPITENLNAADARRTGPATTIQIGDVGYGLGNGTAMPPAPRNGRLAIYPSVFHPAAPTGDSASVITLRAGAEHVDADLHLSPVATVRVSGRVVGPEGLVTMTPLRLVAADTVELNSEMDAIVTMTDRAGLFTFPAVPSGHYTLRMLKGSAPPVMPEGNPVVWAEVALSVGTEDIDDLAVTGQPGLRVGGRIEFEGNGTTRRPAAQAIVPVLEQADAVPGRTNTAALVRVDASGEFRSQPVAGGRYYVRVPNSPAGWMFKSATVDGRDVADTPISLTADVPNAVVTFTDRWSGLRGMVQNRQGADAAAAVIVFPTDNETWSSAGMSPRRVRMIRAGSTGQYALNLPPGDYYVIAVPDLQSADWQDPAFLEAASRAAVRVTITEGQRAVQDLRTRELR